MLTQDGFQSFSLPFKINAATDVTNPYGSYSVRIQIPAAGNIDNYSGGYSRALADTVPLYKLYRDVAFSNHVADAITVTVTGLAASTAYNVKLYSYDYFNSPTSTTDTFTPTGGTTGSSQSVTFVPNVVPTTEDSYAVVANWTSNNSGALAFTTTGTVFGPRLNGFTISSIPEPSTLVLLATGLIGLLCYAWRKRK